MKLFQLFITFITRILLIGLQILTFSGSSSRVSTATPQSSQDEQSVKEEFPVLFISQLKYIDEAGELKYMLSALRSPFMPDDDKVLQVELASYSYVDAYTSEITERFIEETFARLSRSGNGNHGIQSLVLDLDPAYSRAPLQNPPPNAQPFLHENLRVYCALTFAKRFFGNLQNPLIRNGNRRDVVLDFKDAWSNTIDDFSYYLPARLTRNYFDTVIGLDRDSSLDRIIDFITNFSENFLDSIDRILNNRNPNIPPLTPDQRRRLNELQFFAEFCNYFRMIFYAQDMTLTAAQSIVHIEDLMILLAPVDFEQPQIECLRKFKLTLPRIITLLGRNPRIHKNSLTLTVHEGIRANLSN